MKQYETVWEIYNKCSNNQMRDVFIDEAEIDETRLEEYVRRKIRDRNLKLSKSVSEDGTIIFDIDASGIMQRISFTEI